MRLGLMADIHGNREAFEACLTHAAGLSLDGYILLGDYVGYGADPEWVTDKVMQMAQDGAILVVGNHDYALTRGTQDMNPLAAESIAWTKQRLDAAQTAFLTGLPLTHHDSAGRLFVHAEGAEPARFHYICTTEAAARDMRQTDAPTIFCGHVHSPALYGITATEKVMRHVPITGVSVPIPRHRRWLAVLGAVGQPRDGNAAASYAVFDSKRDEITYQRVPYDVDKAAQKIRAAGLPEFLAERLFLGR